TGSGLAARASTISREAARAATASADSSTRAPPRATASTSDSVTTEGPTTTVCISIFRSVRSEFRDVTPGIRVRPLPAVRVAAVPVPAVPVPAALRGVPAPEPAPLPVGRAGRLIREPHDGVVGPLPAGHHGVGRPLGLGPVLRGVGQPEQPPGGPHRPDGVLGGGHPAGHPVADAQLRRPAADLVGRLDHL